MLALLWNTDDQLSALMLLLVVNLCACSVRSRIMSLTVSAETPVVMSFCHCSVVEHGV